MNIFLRELSYYKRGLFFWSIGLALLIASSMAKYAAYSTTGQSVTELMAQLPRAVQVIFGISGFDLSKVTDFYGVTFIYIAITAGIHAVLLGTDIITKEERDKTSEFLFVKPLSRARVMTSKILAGLVNIGVIWLVSLASSLYFVQKFGNTTAISGEIGILLKGLLFIQLIYFFVGVAIASTSQRPKTAPSLATTFVLTTFIISFLVNINRHLEWLRYLTPFKYFDAKTLLDTGALDPVFMVLSAVIIVVSLLLTYSRFTKRDLTI